MESRLLKHLVDITCQRDHALLDRSMVSALHELVGAEQVRVHELFHFKYALFIRPKAWIANDKVVSMEESYTSDRPDEAISNYPGLVSCIRERQTCVEENTDSGKHRLWLPVWLNDTVSTCIEIINPTPYSSYTRHVIEGILSVYRNYQGILDYSERDSLTGLLNRKTFDEKFSRLLASTKADNMPQQEERRHPSTTKSQWLAVLDIDHFKRINDQFGHLYGDEVLILVANLLRSSFRAEDRVFRFGGEEFVVLLQATRLHEARKTFERLRNTIEQHNFPQVNHVTVSIGFAAITQESPVVILGHADQALYYAKANGRNRVCHYNELIEKGLLRSEASKSMVEFF